MLNKFEIMVEFIFQLAWRCDVIAILNRDSEGGGRVRYHIVGIPKPWFSLKSFYASSKILEMILITFQSGS